MINILLTHQYSLYKTISNNDTIWAYQLDMHLTICCITQFENEGVITGKAIEKFEKAHQIFGKYH